jgi:hypothetical protein
MIKQLILDQSWEFVGLLGWSYSSFHVSRALTSSNPTAYARQDFTADYSFPPSISPTRARFVYLFGDKKRDARLPSALWSYQLSDLLTPWRDAMQMAMTRLRLWLSCKVIYGRELLCTMRCSSKKKFNLWQPSKYIIHTAYQSTG